MATGQQLDIPAPRPWRIEGQAIWDADGACVVSALNPANMATRRLIVEAVNGKTEADAPAPLPFGMAEARDEANRRYQETRQEFWAGLADLLADGAALAQHHDADRVKIDRLRDMVQRMAEYIRLGHCNEVHIDRADTRQSYHVKAADLLREAEAALAKEAQP